MCVTVRVFQQLAAQRLCQLLLLGFCTVVLNACAVGPKLADHAFSFDAELDSPDTEVLDYRYGNSKMLAARANESGVREGNIRQAVNINGPFRLGDFLYVKWRNKSTNAIFEETVELRSRLPKNMTRHRIHFVAKGEQLYVYLVTPERRTEDSPPSPLRKYSHLKVITIHPNQ